MEARGESCFVPKTPDHQKQPVDPLKALSIISSQQWKKTVLKFHADYLSCRRNEVSLKNPQTRGIIKN